jgi:hypothetical protein
VKACQECGATFSGHFNARFCGDGCRQRFKRAYIKQWKDAHKPPPKPVKPNPIDPFPDSIDREAFGHWLSGFADGEATFGLRVIEYKDRPRFTCQAYFRICLRDDDAETLKVIRSFWCCGRMYFAHNRRSKIANAKPVAIYSVQSVADIVRVVLPHFRRHPLRAKKRLDLAVWAEGVELMAAIQARPFAIRLGDGGVFPRWSDQDKDQFRSLSAALVGGRKYLDDRDCRPVGCVPVTQPTDNHA